MSIESNSNSLQQLEQSVKIDGMLSREEKDAFQDHFQVECGGINAETSSIVSDFLQTDLLQNLNQFDPLQQIAIQKLIAKHNSENENNTIWENTETLEYFWIPLEVAKLAQESLSSLNMQFIDKLKSYQSYIENQLELPENSSLRTSQHEAIIAHVRKNIWNNISSIPELVSSERAKYSSLSDKEVIGIVNDAIESGFKETKDSVLPNAKLFLTSTIPWFYENSEDIFYARWLENGDMSDDRLDMQVKISNSGLQKEIAELGRALEKWYFDNMPDVYNGWWNIGEQFEESFWMQDGMQEISESSFLSPEDAEKYKSAKIRAVIFMMLQMLPMGITDLAWIGIDIFDTFSSTDQSFEALKGLGMIDADIHVWKAGWEQALSAIGALWGVVSLDIATKWARIMRIMQSAGITTADMLWEVRSFSRDLWLPDGASNAIRKSISWFGSNRSNERFMGIARTNGRLSDTPWTDNYEIAWKILSVSSREKAFLSRLENAYTTGELPFSIGEMNPEQIRHLLDTLGSMHEIHGSVRIWEHSFSQIGDKLAIAREAGIPRNIAKLAIFEGFAGVSDLKNSLEINSHTFKIISKKDENIIALLESIARENWDLDAAVSKVDFDSEHVRYLAENAIGWLFEEEHIEKILAFLKESNVTPPQSFLDMIRENSGYLTTDKAEMTEVFAALKLTQNGGATDKVIETTEVIDTASDTAKVVREIDTFSEIQKAHPQVIDFFDSILNESRDIFSLQKWIDFTSHSVHDAVDFMIENGHGIISQEKLSQLARQLKCSPEDISTDLDFIDGEAWVTYDFLRTVFRKFEETSTRKTLSDNPFEMSIFHLERRIQNTLWEKAAQAAEFLKARPNLQWAIAALENADYHDLQFLKTQLVEVADFHQYFWEEATRKLITEVFNMSDIEFWKLFANINRYGEALSLAEKNNATRITRILQEVWAQKVSPKMIERFQLIETFKNSDWFDGTSESLAYFIGRELGPSSLYIELWQENFITLLQEWLDINIPVDELADFMKTIEWHIFYNVAQLASDAHIAEIKRIREGLFEVIKTAGWKSLKRTNFLAALENSSNDAFKYISSVDTGILRGEKEILIINGDTISKIPTNKITPDIQRMFVNGSIDTLQDHGLDDNDMLLTMITFLQNA
jgi:hypothetical protein